MVIMALCLKIAWVSFSAVLLLINSLYFFYKKREFNLKYSSGCLVLIFIISLFFIEGYSFSSLNIYLGFLLFPLSSFLINYSKDLFYIKKCYVNIFFIIASISVVNWISFVFFEGYYYNLNVVEYFSNLKVNSFRVLSWLYFTHSTFVSFFIITGIIFGYELYLKSKVSKSFFYSYVLFSLFIIILLGSKFSIILLMLLPILLKSTFKQKKILFFLMSLIVCAFIFIYMDFDVTRSELFKHSYDIFVDKKYFGHGFGSSKKILLEYFKNYNYNELVNFNHSHNQYLTFLIETGLFGITLYIVVFYFMHKVFVKNRDESMLVFLITLILLMAVESPFKTTTPLYFVSFIISIFSMNNKFNIKLN